MGNGEKEILFARRYGNITFIEITLIEKSLTQYPLPQYMDNFKNP